MSDLKHQILDYLAHVPGASDTAQGIAEWWLLQQRIRDAAAQVRAALDELTAEGWLRTIQQSDGRIRYAARADRLDELRRGRANGSTVTSTRKP